MKKFKVGIIGGTGYTGSELLRLISLHPNLSVDTVTSESQKGSKIEHVFPHLAGIGDFSFSSIEDLKPDQLDALFLALPHGVSMNFIKDTKAHEKAIVIDLSGDFRLESAESYNTWYPKKHVIPELVSQTVYGMPELFRNELPGHSLVANPGCYPTSSILPLAPLLKEHIVDPDDIKIDAKSGVTGAGANPKPHTHFPNTNENFMAYGLKNHRHTPEIEQTLSRFSSVKTQVLFTPHLLPVNRGILSTIYAKPREEITEKQLNEIYHTYYGNEPFVRLRTTPPKIQQVRGTNFCDIFSTYDERTNTIILVSCIDNLIKGAAGQAIQNVNIQLSLNENTGLEGFALSP